MCDHAAVVVAGEAANALGATTGAIAAAAPTAPTNSQDFATFSFANMDIGYHLLRRANIPYDIGRIRHWAVSFTHICKRSPLSTTTMCYASADQPAAGPRLRCYVGGSGCRRRRVLAVCTDQVWVAE
jgi:hypothetical protein